MSEIVMLYEMVKGIVVVEVRYKYSTWPTNDNFHLFTHHPSFLNIEQQYHATAAL